MNLGKQYISIKNEKFLEVYVRRGLYDYAGIIYKIKQKSTKKILYGYTTYSLDERWENYLNDAISGSNLPIHKEILEILKNGGDPDSEFEKEVIEICFDNKTLKIREKFWIKKNNTTNPKIGFNTNEGGGGNLKNKLKFRDLIYYIACGLDEIEIARKMEVSDKTIRSKVKTCFGGLWQARKILFSPVLKHLINDGYSKEIIATLVNRDKDTINNWCKILF